MSRGLRSAPTAIRSADCCGIDECATRLTLGAISLSSSSHFAAFAGSKLGEPGDVAARAGETLGKTEGDRIGHQRKHNRNGPGLLLSARD